ncbi:MAG: hypothetical protein ACFE0I_18990 [Elainellaceae cyanobacterium]
MAILDTTRRLPNKVLDHDLESFHGLDAVQNYAVSRPNAAPEILQQNYEAMLAARKKETEMTALLKIAMDTARQAEWDFHNSVIAMKESVRGQFGPDSNEAQSVGYKKKSEWKRPKRANKMNGSVA